MSDRDYWGAHYSGQFVGLDAAIWTTPHGEEDSMTRAYRYADYERKLRDEKASLMERFTRKVYQALEDEYFLYPERRACTTPHLRYWAKRLRHFEGRDWEVE